MLNKKNIFRIGFAVGILLFLSLVFWAFGSREKKEYELPHTIETAEKIADKKADNTDKDTDVEIDNEFESSANNTYEEEIPGKFKLEVPFTSQAPYANWDEIHEEACEEASLIMVQYYLKGKSLSQAIAEKEIQELVDFQNKTYGDFKDTNARETVKLAEDYYGIRNLEVITDFTVEDLKRFVYENGPIIVPAAGRELGNPNFTAPGPLYHNLVIIGYDREGFISNDPGTKRGAGYYYNENVLYDAIHDFPGSKASILEGEKAVIVIGTDE